MIERCNKFAEENRSEAPALRINVEEYRDLSADSHVPTHTTNRLAHSRLRLVGGVMAHQGERGRFTPLDLRRVKHAIHCKISTNIHIRKIKDMHPT